MAFRIPVNGALGQVFAKVRHAAQSTKLVGSVAVVALYLVGRVEKFRRARVVHRFHDAVENVGSPISIFDADQRLVAANKAFNDLHLDAAGKTVIRQGITLPQLMAWRGNNGFWRRSPGEGDGSVKHLVDQLNDPKATFDWELADGRFMHVEHRRMTDGSHVSTWTDVSSIRAAESHRRELEMQLYHAQKQEALGQLASGIAHDLNNALVPTLLLTAMVLEDQEEGSSAQTNLALALQGAKRAKELVQRILTFTRKEVAEKRRCELAPVLTEAMTMLRAVLPTTIELKTTIAEVPAVFGDAGELCQVMVNLVTNAAQAIGGKPGRVDVSLGLGDGRLRPIRLSIADTGCGMDESTKARIFDPFFTTKAVNEGTGLGLSIVYGIVTAHGGTITVSSEAGKGTRFDIELPGFVEPFRDEADPLVAPVVIEPLVA